MFNQKFFDDINQKISETIANSPARDIEKNIKAMMGATLARMDLVSREEFDIQQEVLIRTRDQIVALEARVVALEALLNVQDNDASKSADEAVAE